MMINTFVKGLQKFGARISSVTLITIFFGPILEEVMTLTLCTVFPVIAILAKMSFLK